jgi:predicted DNA binding CopG/RHH family protein
MKTRLTGNLDAEEAALLQAFERRDFKIKAATAADKDKARRAAAATLKRDKRMNVRMSSMDMLELQTKAAKLGMPYQTLVASVLHRYLTGRLVAKDV